MTPKRPTTDRNTQTIINEIDATAVDDMNIRGYSISSLPESSSKILLRWRNPSDPNFYVYLNKIKNELLDKNMTNGYISKLQNVWITIISTTYSEAFKTKM